MDISIPIYIPTMKILTVCSGNAEFIKIQHSTLKRYMKSDYEFIVVNACVTKEDASYFNPNSTLEGAMKMCENLGVKFLDLFDKSKNEQGIYDNIEQISNRHSYVLDKILTYMKKYPNKYLVLDSDMFLIDFFSEDDYHGFHSAVVLQERSHIKYAWPGLFYIDMQSAPQLNLFDSFKGGVFDNVPTDSGGGSCRWLMWIESDIPSTTEVRKNEYDSFDKNGIKFIKHLRSTTWDHTEYPNNLRTDILALCHNDSRNTDGKYFSEIYDKRFLHLRGGSGWIHGDKIMTIADKLYKIFF